jgi:FG-GAP repeat
MTPRTPRRWLPVLHFILLLMLLSLPVAGTAAASQPDPPVRASDRLVPFDALPAEIQPLLARALAAEHATRPSSPTAYEQAAKLTASDGAQNDNLGYSVAISGDTIVVGAPNVSSSTGAAYLFVRQGTTWGNSTQTAKLLPRNPNTYDNFGYSVGVSGNTVVVGSPRDQATYQLQGTVAVYVRPDAGWPAQMVPTALLTHGSPAYNDQLGASVAISDDVVAAGAPFRDVLQSGGYNATDQGLVYVFVKPAGGWADKTHDAYLQGNASWQGDEFGTSVAMEGDVVVVGSPKSEGGGKFDGGYAWVFVKPAAGWANKVTEKAQLWPSDLAISDYFGKTVAIGGDTVIVGSPQDDIGANADQGSAYIYLKGSSWASRTQAAKLTASDGAAGEMFGTAVAVVGKSAAVGLSAKGGTGMVYLYEPAGNWANMTETSKLSASDGATGDYFGNSVAMNKDAIVIGANGDTETKLGQGSAYVFAQPVMMHNIYVPICMKE